ncbi:MAG TPA: class I SAM-dependent methyltransferase [Candidatus Sulfotelmatobacter sp.]|jgi:2-polyprenyl-6-hydroxyphenyl methylase/3-demethylubiquinone-9 3-methyltransferase|nr:class I SAM-dependent methyltransferase [Candidatus Sulfotelmatobacter sp.]
MVGFDDLYRQGGAVTWQAGKEDVVRQVADLLMGLGPSARVLDFGCGTGWTAPILTASGARYLGIDPSAEGIAQAGKRLGASSKARFLRIEMGQSVTDALAGAKFTHVFALDALYFVPDLEATIRAVHDALEPEGLLTTISHIYRESRVADSLIDDVTREHGYPQFLSGVQWQLLLESAGFQDVRRYRFYDRRPFNPAAFLGQPPATIALARELYEREGALVVTARR